MPCHRDKSTPSRGRALADPHARRGHSGQRRFLFSRVCRFGIFGYRAPNGGSSHPQPPPIDAINNRDDRAATAQSLKRVRGKKSRVGVRSTCHLLAALARHNAVRHLRNRSFDRLAWQETMLDLPPLNPAALLGLDRSCICFFQAEQP
jgi:hypothetical protein